MPHGSVGVAAGLVLAALLIISAAPTRAPPATPDRRPIAIHYFYPAKEDVTGRSVPLAPRPQVALSATGVGSQPGELIVGQAVQLRVNASGGTPPYNYTWTGLPPSGCGSWTAHLTCSAVGPAGVYTIGVTVKDAALATIVMKTVKVVVDNSANVVGFIQPGTFVWNPPNYFLAGDFWTRLPSPGIPSSIAALISQTAIQHLHFWGDFDKVNLTQGYQGVVWSGGASGGVMGHSVSYNLTNYSSICALLSCTDSIDLPSETNQSGVVVTALRTYENKWNIHPEFVTLGMEISAWNHYGENYSNWLSADNNAPTAANYTGEIQHNIPLLQQVDPNVKFVAQFISGPTSNASWGKYVDAIARSPTLCADYTAMAEDHYPQRGNGFNDANFATFFSNITAVTTQADHLRSEMAALGCTMQVWVDDNAAQGNSTAWQPYLEGTADIPWVAGAIIQCLEDKVGQYAIWTAVQDSGIGLGTGGGTAFSMINTTTLATKPIFQLYSNIFPHFAFQSIYTAPITTAMNGVYSVEGISAGTTYLIDNSNTTVTLTLNLTHLSDPAGATIYTNTGWATTSALYSPNALPLTIAILPGSVVLISIPPAPSIGGGGGGLLGLNPGSLFQNVSVGVPTALTSFVAGGIIAVGGGVALLVFIGRALWTILLGTGVTIAGLFLIFVR